MQGPLDVSYLKGEQLARS